MLRLQIRAQCQKCVKRLFSEKNLKNIAARHVETRKNECNKHTEHTTCNLQNLTCNRIGEVGWIAQSACTILGIICPASFQQVGTKVPWVALGSQQASSKLGMLACLLVALLAWQLACKVA